MSRTRSHFLAADVDIVDSPEQNDLLLRGVVPNDAVATAIAWLEDVFKDSAYSSLQKAVPLASSMTFAVGGGRVFEHTVALGPHELFG